MTYEPRIWKSNISQPDLLAELADLRPESNEEAETLQQLKDYASRKYIFALSKGDKRGHLYLYSVVVNTAGDKVACIQLRGMKGRNKWHYLGGHVPLQATSLDEAAALIANEKLGLPVTALSTPEPLHLFIDEKGAGSHRPHRHFALAMMMRSNSDTIATAFKGSAIQWLSRDDLDERMRSTAGLTAAVLKHLQQD